MPHFVVIPQCPPDPFTWSNASAAGAFSETGQGIIKILDSLGREFSVDPNRFYVTGLSMGAAGTYHLLKNKPGFFAAAVPCAAGGADAAGIPAIGRTRESLLSNKGNITRDSLARAARGGAKYLYSELTGGNHRSGWMIAWRNRLLAEWVFSKSKEGPTTLGPRALNSPLTRNGATLIFGNLPGDAGGRMYSLQGRRLETGAAVAGARAGSPSLLILPASR